MKPGGMIAKARLGAASVPYPALQETMIAILEATLRAAWTETLADQPQGVDFHTASEDDISMVLADALGELCAGEDPPFNEFNEWFQVVIADSTVATKAMTKVSAGDPKTEKMKRKRPDFAFRPKHVPKGYNALYYALFVEAKLIESGKTMGWYCGSGLSRFVCGGYAWSMRQGMMLGYVRNTKQALPDSLNAHFERRGKVKEHCIEQFATPCAFSKHALHESTHGRRWSYRHTHTAPSSIRVFHLWLEI
jgi:hypothetical protein